MGGLFTEVSMAKLYFRHGTVGGAKTLNLLAVAHNYKQQGKRVLLLKPELDDRFGRGKIRSRAGLEMDADILVNKDTYLPALDCSGIDCILVDEVQFMEASIIDQLREISVNKGIPVICYGLRTDFTSHLFEGSKRLMELADSIEEVKATCHFCNRKSIMNLRHVNGIAVSEGPQILVGAEDAYYPTCYKCYQEQLLAAAVLN